eukprot:756574-Hanusia_phi.AAC.6
MRGTRTRTRRASETCTHRHETGRAGPGGETVEPLSNALRPAAKRPGDISPGPRRAAARAPTAAGHGSAGPAGIGP